MLPRRKRNSRQNQLLCAPWTPIILNLSLIWLIETRALLCFQGPIAVRDVCRQGESRDYRRRGFRRTVFRCRNTHGRRVTAHSVLAFRGDRVGKYHERGVDERHGRLKVGPSFSVHREILIWSRRISSLRALRIFLNDVYDLLFTKPPPKTTKKDSAETYDATQYTKYASDREGSFSKFYMSCFLLVKPGYVTIYRSQLPALTSGPVNRGISKWRCV